MIPVGKQFGAWRVEGDGGRDARGRALWTCRCMTCGVTLRAIPMHDVRDGRRGGCADCALRARQAVAAAKRAAKDAARAAREAARPVLRAEYGFWRVLGPAPASAHGEPRVRLECTGPKCCGVQRVEVVSVLAQGRTQSCRACARWRALRSGLGVGGYAQGGSIA